MFKRDFLLRQLERLGALIARVLKLKDQENLDQAFDELTTAYEELFAKHENVIKFADSTTVATILGDEGLVRGLAALTAAEAELYDAKQDPVTATLKRVRALELYVELAISGTRSDDGPAITALAAKVPRALLAERYTARLP